MQELNLDSVFFGNTLLEYILAAGMLILFVLVFGFAGLVAHATGENYDGGENGNGDQAGYGEQP